MSRPVSHFLRFRPVAGAFGGAVLCLWFSAAIVSAHGGVPTLQLGAERVNPGGTIELLGDMTSEGTFELSLIAGTTVRSLGSAASDYEGHFQVFVNVPVDIPTGSYTVHARSDLERASAPLVVAGPPITDDEGQLPGQDEIFAPVPTLPAEAAVASGGASDPLATAGSTGPSVDLAIALVAVTTAVAGALALGALARRRARRAPGR